MKNWFVQLGQVRSEKVSDYLPFVESVKRSGKNIYLMFFGRAGFGLEPKLRLASDKFFDVEASFCEGWRRQLIALNK